ncbi:MAG: GNAT family N-acetyltransferase [Kiritimatiellia bacterium]|jgi:amino-acid N-acetyltransferase
MSEAESKLHVRPAVLGDAVTIYHLIRSYPNELIVRSVANIVQNIDRFVVCERDGALVGCAAWSILPEMGDPHNTSVELQSLAVHRDHCNTGIGGRLVKAVLERIRPFQPAQVIVLTMTPEFFRKLGFAEVPKTQLMHKIYTGCVNCMRHSNPFTCPEIAMALDLRR